MIGAGGASAGFAVVVVGANVLEVDGGRVVEVVEVDVDDVELVDVELVDVELVELVELDDVLDEEDDEEDDEVLDGGANAQLKPFTGTAADASK